MKVILLVLLSLCFVGLIFFAYLFGHGIFPSCPPSSVQKEGKQ